MPPSHHRPGRLVIVVATAALLAAACGSDDDPSAPDETPDATVTTSTAQTAETTADDTGSSSSTSTSTGSSTTNTSVLQPDSTRGTGPDQQAPPPGADEEAMAELRDRLGVTKVVVRARGLLVSDNGSDRFELPDDFAEVHPAHLVIGVRILDDTGEFVCPELVVGDDGVIVDVVRSDSGSTVVTMEDRRPLVFDGGAGETPIERWTYDCDSGQRSDLDPAASATWTGDVVFERRIGETGPVLVTEWGLGDTPAVVTTGDGIELIAFDDVAWDHALSPDGATLYYTSFAGTAAAAPPRAVTAVDTTTGVERWTVDLPGFVHVVDDRVIIEVVDASALNDLGWFDTTDLIVVDGATGAVLDEFPFANDLVGIA
ncbi:MAG: hypothetical protein AAGA93_21530 [Actinomycetota bacterium]